MVYYTCMRAGEQFPQWKNRAVRFFLGCYSIIQCLLASSKQDKSTAIRRGCLNKNLHHVWISYNVCTTTKLQLKRCLRTKRTLLNILAFGRKQLKTFVSIKTTKWLNLILIGVQTSLEKAQCHVPKDQKSLRAMSVTFTKMCISLQKVAFWAFFRELQNKNCF